MDGRSLTVFAAAAAIGASFYVFLTPDGKKKKGVKRDHPPGLVNLGNTCFMNSILQGLAFLPSFAAWLQDISDEGDGNSLTSLAMELKKIMKALNNGCMEGEEVICPDSVLKALSSHGWIIPSEQQDAHEFFHALSSTLDDEMGELPGVMNLSDVAIVEKNDDNEDKSMVHRNKVPLRRDYNKPHLPFHGLLASQLVCKQCGTKCPVKFDSYDSLSLSLPSTFQVGLSLEDLLRTFVCSEIVDSVECNGCEERNSVQSSGSVRTSFIKRLTLGKLPQCLCIHIQRTYWHTNGIPYKNNAFIKFPEFLDMEPFLYEPLEQHSRQNGTERRFFPPTAGNGDLNGYLDELVGSFVAAGNKRPPFYPSLFMERVEVIEVKSKAKESHCTVKGRHFEQFQITSRAVYKLMAVIVHMGTVDDGHYITFRRFETEHASKWLYASDELVEATSRDQVLLSSAYMLFYERTRK